MPDCSCFAVIPRTTEIRLQGNQCMQLIAVSLFMLTKMCECSSWVLRHTNSTEAKPNGIELSAGGIPYGTTTEATASSGVIASAGSLAVSETLWTILESSITICDEATANGEARSSSFTVAVSSYPSPTLDDGLTSSTSNLYQTFVALTEGTELIHGAVVALPALSTSIDAGSIVSTIGPSQTIGSAYTMKSVMEETFTTEDAILADEGRSSLDRMGATRTCVDEPAAAPLIPFRDTRATLTFHNEQPTSQPYQSSQWLWPTTQTGPQEASSTNGPTFRAISTERQTHSTASHTAATLSSTTTTDGMPFDDDKKPDSAKLKTVGICIGAVGGAMVSAGIAVWFVKRNRKKVSGFQAWKPVISWPIPMDSNNSGRI